MAADGSPLDRYLGTPEFEAFAATIAAAPADEAPRLVLSDWFREQGDDAAADLAALPPFATQLAFARSRKAAGGSGPTGVCHFGERFRGPRDAIRVRMMPYIERVQPVAIVEGVQKRPKPATQSVARPGRRQAMPQQKRKPGN